MPYPEVVLYSQIVQTALSTLRRKFVQQTKVLQNLCQKLKDTFILVQKKIHKIYSHEGSSNSTWGIHIKTKLCMGPKIFVAKLAYF